MNEKKIMRQPRFKPRKYGFKIHPRCPLVHYAMEADRNNR